MTEKENFEILALKKMQELCEIPKDEAFNKALYLFECWYHETLKEWLFEQRLTLEEAEKLTGAENGR